MLRGPTQWHVAQKVLDRIVNDPMEPGARINQLALARSLGVSRTPVRAVLLQLADKGILDQRPRQGFFLARKPDAVEDVAFDGSQPASDAYERMVRDLLLDNLRRTMSQSALMRRYGIKRGELTATLRRMTREGLAEPAPGRGWTFVQFGAAVIEKGYRLRLILEPAVLLSDDYAPNEQALRALRDDHVAALRALSSRTPWSDLFNLDSRFHVTLAEGSGNELIVAAIQKQNSIRRLNEYLGYERLDRVQSSLSEHLGILESLIEGDREWAAAQLRRHLKASLRQSLQHFDRDIEDFRQGKRRLSGAERPGA